MNFREWLQLDEAGPSTRQRASGYTPEPSHYGSRNSEIDGLQSFQSKISSGNLTNLISKSMPGNEKWRHKDDGNDSDVIAVPNQHPLLINIDKKQVLGIPTRWGKPPAPLPDGAWWQENKK